MRGGGPKRQFQGVICRGGGSAGNGAQDRDKGVDERQLRVSLATIVLLIIYDNHDSRSSVSFNLFSIF